MTRHARLGVGAVVVHGKAALRSAYVSAPKLIAPEVAVAKPLPQEHGGCVCAGGVAQRLSARLPAPELVHAAELATPVVKAAAVHLSGGGSRGGEITYPRTP